MKMSKMALGIVAAITFQFAVLVGMVGSSALPIITGTEIQLRTRPVDPRSLFRGNYARLSYDISVLDNTLLPEVDLRSGEKIYVSLVENEQGIHELSSVSLVQPEYGLFIRGRVQIRSNWAARNSVQVNYGIEAFFAAPEEALALEVELRSSRAVAEVSVSSGGVARLTGVREQ